MFRVSSGPRLSLVHAVFWLVLAVKLCKATPNEAQRADEIMSAFREM